MSTSLLREGVDPANREIDGSRGIPSQEPVHRSDQQAASAYTPGGRRQRSGIILPHDNDGESQEGVRGDLRYARNPQQRHSSRRNLNPSPPSGRRNGQTTPRNIEKLLEERDNEIAHLQSQVEAMREAIARRDERSRGRSQEWHAMRRADADFNPPSPRRDVSRAASTSLANPDRTTYRVRGNPEPQDWGKWLDDELNRRDQRPPVRTAQDIARRALDQISSTPFVEEIEARQPPRKFSMPKFTPYDGKTDPIAHVRHYKQMMALWSGEESLMCRVFPSSLGDVALRWFDRLPPRTIASWRQLAELFANRFIANSCQPKEVDYLLTMQKKDNEGLRAYARRYWEAYNEIEECTEQLAVTQFKVGLPREHRLRQSLMKKPASRIQDLMLRIEQHARVEEDDGAIPHEKVGKTNGKTNGREAKKPRREENGNKGRRAAEFVNTVFKEPLHKILPRIRDKPFFKWPPKMAGDPASRDQKKFCSYHREKGHLTEECRLLKSHCEELARAGHLEQYVDRRKTRPETARLAIGPPQTVRDEPVRVINVLHASTGQAAIDPHRYRAEIQKAAHLREVMQVQQISKRPKLGKDAEEITFSDDDLIGIQQPHNDALVITLRIADCAVKRLLIDQGSSSEVMFYDLFKKLGLTDADLKPSVSPLVGFSSQPVWPLGKVTVPVTAGGVTLQTEFLVVNVPSPYNAIIGRTWLHHMRAVPSTYHQVMRFPTPEGIQEIRGDQVAAKQCFLAAHTTQQKSGASQMMELREEMPTIDDVGGIPEKKAVEDLKKIQIDRHDEEKYFMVGTTLGKHEEKQLLDLLTQYLEIFAWTPYEMPGISTDITCHRLNVDPHSRPVMQKARRSAIQHTDAVVEEVGRLLEAGAIREVYYPRWLSNTVVVKKKDGRWRVCVDFTDLNKACPKDPFPLPRIDQLVDSTAGFERMSFLDAYRGYHQIPLHKDDQEKTAFITPRGIFCYKVMPFGLKNAGATYQRLVTRMFSQHIGSTVEVYIDDMVVKSKVSNAHLGDLRQVFDIMKKYSMRLNASKCVFGVSSGKFLGFLVTHRGIEADPQQISAIQNIQAPRSIKEVQKLTGMAAALNRFISRSSDKCHLFFQLLRKRGQFTWTTECDQALADLKRYLTEAPLLSTPSRDEELFLYLAVSDHAVSAVLLRQEGRLQRPVYYVSKTLLEAENRYLPLEKLALALVMASRKLVHYFRAHTVNVLTDHQLKSLLRKADFSGRLAKWAVELGEFDIKFQPRSAIKGQVMADFIAEFSNELLQEAVSAPAVELTHPTPEFWEASDHWKLFVDGASNDRGAGSGIVLITPDGMVLEQAIKLDFTASNNESEYEALLAGLRRAVELQVAEIAIYSDSQLVVNQVLGDYAAKNDRMAQYLAKAKELLGKFRTYKLYQISRDKNSHADALATLAAALQSGSKRIIHVETLAMPSIFQEEDLILSTLQLGPSWMDPIIAYLERDELPTDRKEARKVQNKALKYWLSPSRELYRRSFTGPYLHCVHPDKVTSILFEIHEGICGSHTGGRSLAHRAISQGYWWPYMQKDAAQYVLKCEKCQKFSPIIHQPAEDLTTITSPWPFAQWGLDIVGPLPRAPGNKRFLIVATDYFTKWVEAEPLSTIRDVDAKRFTWRNIITRFGIPRALVSDNGTQFDGNVFRSFCTELGIRNYYSTPAYPQCNGQAEISNKTVLNGIKKRLEKAKGRWAEELPSVLWSYRTTPRRSTGETPFSMAYGVEAVIPLEVGVPTIRTAAFDTGLNDQALAKDLDLAEERREAALIRLTGYHQQLSRLYNKQVQPRAFAKGDLVLRRVLGAMKNPADGKLGPNWEGPYRVASQVGVGAYRLETVEDERQIPRPWNANNLKKFYQ